MSPFRQRERDQQDLRDVATPPAGEKVDARYEYKGREVYPEEDVLRGANTVLRREELVERGVDP